MNDNIAEVILKTIYSNDNLTTYDYISLYLDLIEKCRERDLNKISGQYTELHHILPKSKGGNNNEDNLVRLTIKEHVLAHILLYLAYPEDDLFAFSVYCLLKMGNTRYRKSDESFSKNELLEKLNLLESSIVAVARKYSRRQGRPVVCYQINSMKVLRVYRSASSANELDGFRIEGIYAFIAGKQTEVGGCGFCYLEKFKETNSNELDEYYENLYDGFLPNIDEYRIESGRIHKKAVVAFDESKAVVGIYNSIRETEVFGCKEKSLSKAIRTKGKHMGYYWDFYDNFIKACSQEIDKFVLSGKESITEFHKTKRVYKTKAVAKCDIDSGKIIEIFSSLRSVKTSGYDPATVWRVINGRLSKYRGYFWKYLI